jgi:hypothetical protein
MNKLTLLILAAVAIAAAAVAPVIANDRKAKAAAGKCGMFMKFDKKSKSCHWKL